MRNRMLVQVHLVMMGIVADHAIAQHTGDVYIALQGQQIVTGQINSDQTITIPVRVFKGTFGDSGFEGFTSNPGFDTTVGMFNLWNGTTFVPIGGETLNISFLTLEDNTAMCFVPGFDLAVQPNGGWHRHLSYTLNPGGNGLIDPGVYLLKLELYYTVPGSIDSPAFWLVLRHLASSTEHDAASAWSQANLPNPPCPADVTGNGVVNVDDLLAIINGWGIAPCSSADIAPVGNANGIVNVDDQLAVINGWGPCH